METLDAPKLRVLRVAEFGEELALPPLQGLVIAGWVCGDVSGVQARTIIHEWEHGDDEADGVMLQRSGRGRFGERAFLLTTASEEAVRRAVRMPEGRRATVSVCRFEFGCQEWTAAALRMEGATDGAPLRGLSQALARGGARTLEFAVSPSNVERIAWSRWSARRSARRRR